MEDLKETTKLSVGIVGDIVGIRTGTSPVKATKIITWANSIRTYYKAML